MSSVIAGTLAIGGCSGPMPSGPTVLPKPSVPKSVVIGAVEATRSTPAPDAVTYVFAIQLNESGGVPATITSAWINFDDGFGGSCDYPPGHLTRNRIPANGALTMDPLTCGPPGGDEAFNASVNVNITDDNGYKTTITLRVASL